MKVLYIASSPNGGSTLLSLLLGRHERVANLGELSFVPKLLALQESCTCGELLSVCGHWGLVFDSLVKSHGVDLRKQPYALHFGDAIKDGHGSGRIDHDYQTTGRKVLAKLVGAVDTAALFGAPSKGLLNVITPSPVREGIDNTLQFYRVAADTWRKNVIIDASKLPRKAPHLYLRFPEQVRVLHLIRDARGVATSRMKSMSVERAAKRWNHYHTVTRRILQRWVPPEHRMRLRYEDFVTEPDDCLRQLCNWMDLDYSSAMLDFSHSADAHSAGGNPARFSFAEGIRPPDMRWKSVLDADQLATVERLAGALNREFGYE